MIEMPPLAQKFIDAALEIYTSDSNNTIQDWAITRTTTNCGWLEYRIAQFILKELRNNYRDR